jgi:Cu2+-exporting ATPase
MLPWVVDVARAVRRTIITNLLWAFGYNFIALTAAALGLLQPILAAAVMAGSSVLVVMNSIWLLRLPEPVSSDIVGPQAQEFHQELPPNTSAVKAEYQPTA